jgi:hypothetical protein
VCRRSFAGTEGARQRSDELSPEAESEDPAHLIAGGRAEDDQGRVELRAVLGGLKDAARGARGERLPRRLRKEALRVASTGRARRSCSCMVS